MGTLFRNSSTCVPYVQMCVQLYMCMTVCVLRKGKEGQDGHAVQEQLHLRHVCISEKVCDEEGSIGRPERKVHAYTCAHINARTHTHARARASFSGPSTLAVPQAHLCDVALVYLAHEVPVLCVCVCVCVFMHTSVRVHTKTRHAML